MKDDSSRNIMSLEPMHFYILFTLKDIPLDGYGIKIFIEERTNKSIPISGLYRHLQNLETEGMIDYAKQPEENDDDRRQYFEVTTLGKEVYQSEYNRLENLINPHPLDQLKIRILQLEPQD